VLLSRALGIADQLRQGRRRALYQIRAPVQHADVHEPGQCKERVPPPIRGNGRGEEGGRVRAELIEGKDPSGGGELRGPDGVELEDVRITRAGVQPLDVELVPLIRGVRRVPPFHPDPGMLGIESGELPYQDLGLRSQRAAGEGDDDRATIGLPGACGDKKNGEEKRGPHG
jgi:hypothetical protein